MFNGKTVLITGGTGSFGTAFARHLLQQGVGQIRIFSRDETKQDAMRRSFDDERIRFYIGDIRDRRSIDPAMKGTELVFHAAALKQVPACELFPDQAVRTNILGSENVIESAEAFGIDRVVCLSTDKAVYPINVMGMTKALMEKTVQAAARRIGENGPTICIVRYGNVLNSRGSIIPVIVDQIKRGQPITITAPNMTRFLLTLTDAVGLIETALMHGRPGDTFVRKSPAATVDDIAQAIKTLYRSNADIRIIGVRPGEKFHETLCTFSEIALSFETNDFFRIRSSARTEIDHNVGRTAARNEDFTSDRAKQLNLTEVQDVLSRIPEIAEDLRDYLRLRGG